MTVKKANKLLKKWKKKLGLQNWYIFLVINQPIHKMDGCSGLIEWQTTHSSAIIKIIDEKEVDIDSIVSFDFEKVLVHELLHIKFGTFEPRDQESIEYKEFHRNLEDMARLLTGYKNKFKPKEC